MHFVDAKGILTGGKGHFASGDFYHECPKGRVSVKR